MATTYSSWVVYYADKQTTSDIGKLDSTLPFSLAVITRERKELEESKYWPTQLTKIHPTIDEAITNFLEHNNNYDRETLIGILLERFPSERKNLAALL